ncbi:hypothetical protein I7I50_04568 [Histoplasma capsulatum G186AR]|nr:hypothetical protein I7I52_05477 [Histoplasma capsulatum]QSS75436.1 hypothetical protein I7I50_04568 [Histoplasma capsulatum G186AR]
MDMGPRGAPLESSAASLKYYDIPACSSHWSTGPTVWDLALRLLFKHRNPVHAPKSLFHMRHDIRSIDLLCWDLFERICLPHLEAKSTSRALFRFLRIPASPNPVVPYQAPTLNKATSWIDNSDPSS